MANYTADQLTQTTDPSAAAFACAPFAGGNSLFATVTQIVTYGSLAGGLQLPSNSGGAGYDLVLSAGDAGATGRGGNVYVKVGAQNTSGGNGSVIFLDQTGATIFTLSATGTFTGNTGIGLTMNYGGNNAIVVDSSGNLTIGGTQNTTTSNLIVKTNFALWSNTANAMHLSNVAFNAGARLIFGSAVSTGWACIKPNAAQLQVRLADDSADAPITASYVQTVPTVVASLPAAATAGKGARAFVTDANATTYASIVAGSGANNVPVYSDGTNWRIG